MSQVPTGDIGTSKRLTFVQRTQGMISATISIATGSEEITSNASSQESETISTSHLHTSQERRTTQMSSTPLSNAVLETSTDESTRTSQVVIGGRGITTELPSSPKTKEVSNDTTDQDPAIELDVTSVSTAAAVSATRFRPSDDVSTIQPSATSRLSMTEIRKTPPSSGTKLVQTVHSTSTTHKAASQLIIRASTSGLSTTAETLQISTSQRSTTEKISLIPSSNLTEPPSAQRTSPYLTSKGNHTERSTLSQEAHFNTNTSTTQMKTARGVAYTTTNSREFIPRDAVSTITPSAALSTEGTRGTVHYGTQIHWCIFPPIEDAFLWYVDAETREKRSNYSVNDKILLGCTSGKVVNAIPQRICTLDGIYPPINETQLKCEDPAIQCGRQEIYDVMKRKCKCRRGYYRQKGKCSRMRSFYGNLRLLRRNGRPLIFKKEYTNIYSKEYQELNQTVIDTLDEVFRSSPQTHKGYRGVEISRLMPGSIIVDYTVIFSYTSNIKEATVRNVVNQSLFQENKGYVNSSDSSILLHEDFNISGLIDECHLNIDDCSIAASCTDTVDFFECQCKDGYVDESPDGIQGRVCTLSNPTGNRVIFLSTAAGVLLLLSVLMLCLCCYLWLCVRRENEDDQYDPWDRQGVYLLKFGKDDHVSVPRAQVPLYDIVDEGSIGEPAHEESPRHSSRASSDYVDETYPTQEYLEHRSTDDSHSLSGNEEEQIMYNVASFLSRVPPLTPELRARFGSQNFPGFAPSTSYGRQEYPTNYNNSGNTGYINQAVSEESEDLRLATQAGAKHPGQGTYEDPGPCATYMLTTDDEESLPEYWDTVSSRFARGPFDPSLYDKICEEPVTEL